ncbi:MAG: V-type ATPase subunit [Oscillospiraceae bacterium]|jgi:V/A-type H+-transporting ATPase subunit C|nr:V-type ATPase subunit [Oscillospiraceae bacterium]
MKRNFLYGISRVKVRELSLLSEYDAKYLERSCSTYTSCMEFLKNRGWGTQLGCEEYKVILKQEKKKLWKFLFDVSMDKTLFSSFLVWYDYQNLKLAIKAVVKKMEEPIPFDLDGLVPAKDIYEIIKNNEIKRLPEYMREAAIRAKKTLLHVCDGWAYDSILDKDTLTVMNQFAANSGSKLTRFYVDTLSACSNIKIVLREALLKRPREVLMKAFYNMEGLDFKKMLDAALRSRDDLCEYLLVTEYGDCVTYIRNSLSLDTWFDRRTKEKARHVEIDVYSFDPIVAYLIERLSEIKFVGGVISSKIDDLVRDIMHTHK